MKAMNNIQNNIDKEKQHFKDQIVLYKKDERQKELEKIGADAKIYIVISMTNYKKQKLCNL